MKNKIFMITSIGIFILLTFSKMIHHWPFFDESHAWTLAQIMNFSNFIEILRIEGHPILWFLIIMPFAKQNILFPYSLYITNYIFCLLALMVMWLKSPFETYYKIVITFSSIFISYYSFTARCYSVGILGIFILLSLYRNQLKRPILYSLLIGLSAHTNLLCAISASYLGIVFIYKLIKSSETKLRDTISAILIISGFIFAWIYPYISYIGKSVQFTKYEPGLYVLKSFFLYNTYNIVLLSSYITLFALITFLAKDLTTKGFLLYTTFFIIIFMNFFYPLAPHHFLFLFVNIIFAFWLFCINNDSKQHSILLYFMFFILFMFPLDKKISYLYVETLQPVVEYINKTNISDKLYFDPNSLKLASIIPFIDVYCPFPDRSEIKHQNIKDGYYITKEKLEQYPLVYNYKYCYIYRIKN